MEYNGNTMKEKQILHYQGKWVAWSKGRKQIIAASKSVKEAYNEALKKGHKEPLIEKIPYADKGFCP